MPAAPILSAHAQRNQRTCTKQSIIIIIICYGFVLSPSPCSVAAMSDTEDQPQPDANVGTAEKVVKDVEQEKEQSVVSVEDGAGNVEDEEEKGLMGEIMDLVRNGSPANDDKKIPDPEEGEANEIKQKTVDEESEDRGNKEGESIDAEGEASGVVPVNKTEETICEADPKTEENAKEAGGEEEIVQNKAATEEKHFVTPHLLSDEEIIAKGVAESDIEMYRSANLTLWCTFLSCFCCHHGVFVFKVCRGYCNTDKIIIVALWNATNLASKCAL